jgi:hypothetical protein
MASRSDQLIMVREAVFLLLSKLPQNDLKSRRICASCPRRYVEGGYSNFHYVTVAPNDHEASFELFEGDQALGFISIAAQEYAIEPHVGTWPFKVDGRPLDVASISRAVLLPEARGRSLLPVLLEACSLYHQLGIPVRITTRKREVAEKALAMAPCLMMDLKSRSYSDRVKMQPVTTLVPYDEGLASNSKYFQTRAPNASARSRRRRNEGYHFWYCGSPITHSRTKAAFVYDVGTGRFEEA